jgi:hypothetical protein
MNLTTGSKVLCVSVELNHPDDHLPGLPDLIAICGTPKTAKKLCRDYLADWKTGTPGPIGWSQSPGLTAGFSEVDTSLEEDMKDYSLLFFIEEYDFNE